MTKDVSDEVASNIFASLLAGVQRYDPQWYGPHESGRYVLFEDVIAALAAAADPELLAEAGEHVRLLRLSPWSDGYPRLDELPDLITSLLARIAAQEAQIKGHQDHVDTLNEVINMSNATAHTLETALAAERTKTAKLVEALTFYSCKDGCNDCSENERDLSGCGWTARAAITEAGQ